MAEVNLDEFQALAGHKPRYTSIKEATENEAGWAAEEKLSAANMEAIKLVAQTLGAGDRPLPGYWSSSVAYEMAGGRIYAQLGGNYLPKPQVMLVIWKAEVGIHTKEFQRAQDLAIGVIEDWERALKKYGTTAVRIQRERQFAGVSVEIPLWKMDEYIGDLDKLAVKFAKMLVAAGNSDQKEEGAVEKTSVVEASAGKYPVSAFPEALRKVIKGLSKKRSIYVTRATTFNVTPSMHAPEYDNFDYSYELQVDLITGKTFDLRAGMEKPSKNTPVVPKSIQLTTTSGAISGERHSGYLNFYLHPDAELHLGESIVDIVVETVLEAVKRARTKKPFHRKKRKASFVTLSSGKKVRSRKSYINGATVRRSDGMWRMTPDGWRKVKRKTKDRKSSAGHKANFKKDYAAAVAHNNELSFGQILRASRKHPDHAKHGRAQSFGHILRDIRRKHESVIDHLDEAAKKGICAFCGEKNTKLVARLKADPDQKVCAVCARDKRIPTEPLAEAAAPKAPKKLKGKALEKEISRLYYKNGNGVQVNMFDLGKIWKAGEDANTAGQDMEPAIIAAIQKYKIEGIEEAKATKATAKKLAKKYAADLDVDIVGDTITIWYDSKDDEAADEAAKKIAKELGGATVVTAGGKKIIHYKGDAPDKGDWNDPTSGHHY